MPTSIDPQPEENEIECARCGSYFFYELTHCPECGVNIYDPDEFDYESKNYSSGVEQGGILSKAKDLARKIFGKPYSAEEVFGDSLDQAILYNDLLQKVNGDRSVLERLVTFEQKQIPDGTRMIWLQKAIERWNRDNRIPK